MSEEERKAWLEADAERIRILNPDIFNLRQALKDDAVNQSKENLDL